MCLGGSCLSHLKWRRPGAVSSTSSADAAVFAFCSLGPLSTALTVHLHDSLGQALVHFAIDI